MPTIHIRNIGPIADSGVIELTSVNLFIGKPSSGKSTLLKIMCYCQWIEKHVSIGYQVNGKSMVEAYTHYYRFIKDLMRFHRFNADFFVADSEIIYHGECVDIHFKGDVNKNARINTKSHPNKYNSKICFVPSERNLLSSMKNIQDGYRSSDMDMLFNFVLEWNEYKEAFSASQPLTLAVAPNIQYYYDKKHGERISITDTERPVPPFSPFYASSGIQSAFPLEVIAHSLRKSVGKNAKLSPADMTQILARMIQDGASAKELKQAIENKAVEAKKMLQYQAFELFVEEPEQNLFPESQSALVYRIVGLVNEANQIAGAQRSYVVMTTHSPYILSALNTLMAATEACERDRTATERIVSRDLILPRGAISAYCIDADGKVQPLIDSELYMIDGTWLDGVSDEVETRLTQLNEIICG